MSGIKAINVRWSVCGVQWASHVKHATGADIVPDNDSGDLLWALIKLIMTTYLYLHIKLLLHKLRLYRYIYLIDFYNDKANK